MARRHPAQRFEAPNTILHGVPLLQLFQAALIRLIGDLLGMWRSKTRWRTSNRFATVLQVGLTTLAVLFAVPARAADNRLIDHFPEAAKSGCMKCHAGIEPIREPGSEMLRQIMDAEPSSAIRPDVWFVTTAIR